MHRVTHVEETIGVRGGGTYPLRAGEGTFDLGVTPPFRILTPGKRLALEPASGGFLSLRLGWEANGEPTLPGEPPAVTPRLGPVHAHHGLLGVFEARCFEPGGGLRSHPFEIDRVLGVGDRSGSHLEGRNEHPVNGGLIVERTLPSHQEWPRGNESSCQKRGIRS